MGLQDEGRSLEAQGSERIDNEAMAEDWDREINPGATAEAHIGEIKERRASEDDMPKTASRQAARIGGSYTREKCLGSYQGEFRRLY